MIWTRVAHIVLVCRDDGSAPPKTPPPTEKRPRSFDIDPSGRFLFAAAESSGRLAGCRIDAATGKLERIATYEAGKMAWWVMAVRLAG